MRGNTQATELRKARKADLHLERLAQRARDSFASKAASQITAIGPRLARLARRYGLTEAQYIDLHNKQGGRCAICRSASGIGSPLVIDHCHESSAVRGLLCRRCNVLIGRDRDRKPEWFRAAWLYLLDPSK